MKHSPRRPSGRLAGLFWLSHQPSNRSLGISFSPHAELGRAFLQAESELGAINMVYGAACTGARVMTSTSSPGTSLMMDGLSYIAATEVPMVLGDVVRGGPGLGTIQPSQGDYNQIVHGGGHGDYHCMSWHPPPFRKRSIRFTNL